MGYNPLFQTCTFKIIMTKKRTFLKRKSNNVTYTHKKSNLKKKSTSVATSFSSLILLMAKGS